MKKHCCSWKKYITVLSDVFSHCVCVNFIVVKRCFIEKIVLKTMIKFQRFPPFS